MSAPMPPASNPVPQTSASSNEDVVKGGLFALLAIPLGVILLVLLSSIGFVASIVGFVVAFSALWLYRRGSGGFISRSGAFVVTAIVLVALLVGIWLSLAVGGAGGLGHLALLGDARYWDIFAANFGSIVQHDGLFILLVLAFGVLGSFRILGRAFATARQPRTHEQLFGQAPTAPYGSAPYGSTPGAAAPTNSAGSITPTSYQNDVDGAPSAGADDKTKPPTTEP